MTKDKFTQQLADLTGLEVGSDDLRLAHQKLAARLGAELYSDEILEAARALAAQRIHMQRFDRAFNAAVVEGRALPSQRPLLRRFAALDVEGALSLVAALKPVSLPAPGVTARRAPEGVDVRRFDLDQRTRAYALEHGVDYAVALDRVRGAA